MEKLNKKELMEKWEKLDFTDKLSIVDDMSSYDGAFENLNYHENDEDFFNTYFEDGPMEVARAIYYGDYNFSDDYVRFDGYGNLESATKWDAEKEIDDEKEDIIDTIIESDDVYDVLQYFEEVA